MHHPKVITKPLLPPCIPPHTPHALGNPKPGLPPLSASTAKCINRALHSRPTKWHFLSSRSRIPLLSSAHLHVRVLSKEWGMDDPIFLLIPPEKDVRMTVSASFGEMCPPSPPPAGFKEELPAARFHLNSERQTLLRQNSLLRKVLVRGKTWSQESASVPSSVTNTIHPPRASGITQRLCFEWGEVPSSPHDTKM